MAQSNPGSPTPRRARGFVLAIASATCYGVQGLFFSIINRKFALSSETMVFYRTFFAFLALLIVLPVFHRDALRMRVRDLPIFVLLGVVGMATFYFVIAKSVLLAGVAVTEVLLYTGPLWISLFAWKFMGEGLDRAKGIALLTILVGAALVCGLTDPSRIRISPAGFAIALTGGIGLAVYTLMSKIVLRKYSPWTVMFYGLLFAVPTVTLLQDMHEVSRAATLPGALPWLIGLAIGPSLIAAMLYNACLLDLPASVASIVSTWEPVVATILAFLVLGERLAPIQLVGAALIIGSIVLMGSSSLRGRRKRRVEVARLET
jgi:drug/metabolite transporter, DME family